MNGTGELATLTAEQIEMLKLSAAPALRCPKCHVTSGDDWSQCAGACPMPGSPHYTTTEVFTRGELDVMAYDLLNIIKRHRAGPLLHDAYNALILRRSNTP